MVKSNQEKARELVLRVQTWMTECEASGERDRYLSRDNKLNKSFVAEKLGFSRSLWRSNKGLAELAKSIDARWSQQKVSTHSALKQLDQVIEAHIHQGTLLPNDGFALKVVEVLKIADLRPIDFQRQPEIRRKLETYAKNNGLVFARSGEFAPEEEMQERVVPPEMVPASRLRDLQRKLAQAERKNAELKAENVRLRSQMMQADEVANLIAFGGRIKP